METNRKSTEIQKSNDRFGYRIGKKYNDRYQIENFLGEGTFGTVFKVKDLKEPSEPTKAIKIYYHQLESEVLSEIEILKKNESNYLVKYFDSFSEKIHFIMVFEFCKNGDLKHLIENHKSEGKRFENEKIKNHALDILDGLDYLHSNLGLIHFNLKPTNILMDESDRCKIGDLGIAPNNQSLSKLSLMRGTLAYMSPELVNLDKKSRVDFKTDIWSFGCILFEMCTLQNAFFDVDMLKIKINILRRNYEIPQYVNEVFKDIINLCLVKKDDRKMSSRDLSNKIRERESDLKVESTESDLLNSESKDQSNSPSKDKNNSDLNEQKNSESKDQKKSDLKDQNTSSDSKDPKKLDWKNRLNFQSTNNKELKKENADLKSKLGKFYYDSGDYNNALKHYDESYQILQKLHQDDHLDVAESLNTLGNAYYGLGDYEKALKFYDESLTMRRKLKTGNHADIAESLNNVANAHYRLVDYKNAFKFYAQSLKMRRNLFKEDNPDTAQSLIGVANAYFALGDYKNASKYFSESLEMNRKLYSGDHPDTALSLMGIGNSYERLGDYGNALKFNSESLKMKKNLFSGDHSDVAKSLNNVANAYYGLADYNNALKFYNESLEMYRKLYKQDNSNIASLLTNIGTAYYSQCDYKNALKFYNESLEISKKLFGDDHPLVVSTINNIKYTKKKL